MSSKKYNLWFIALSTGTANIGFLFFDYNMSVFNNVLPYMKKFIFADAASGAVTFVASATVVTAAIAALLTGNLVAKFGRRSVMIWSDVVGIIGVALTLVANLAVVIVGRLLVGVNVGITTVVVSVYFAEIPPIQYVGRAGIGLSILASFGVLSAFALGLLIPEELAPGETSQAWRVLQGISIIFALVRIANFLLFFKYDTPQYLIANNRYEEAEKALAQVYKEGVKEKLEELIKERDFVSTQGTVTFFELFTQKYRRAMIAAIVMMSIQQLCGFNLVMVFAKTILGGGIEEGSKLPAYYSIALAGVFHCTSYTLFFFLERFNRKTLLVVGAFVLGLFEILFGVISKATSPDNFASKIFMILWPLPFALSTGTIPNIAVPETLPEIGVSVSLLASWIWGFLTVQFFPDISDSIGVDGTFIIIGGICILSSIYFYFEVVETKGRSKVEILQEYNGTLKKGNKISDINYNELQLAEKKESDLETLKPTPEAESPAAIEAQS